MKIAYCKYNPKTNPFWCNVIWGYCQFQINSFINEHCPIFQGYPRWPISVQDVDDQFCQTYSYATIYDDGEQLVSLGDTAFQKYSGNLSLNCKYVRYIGRFAFQDCENLQTLDFSEISPESTSIPVLASPEAFMKDDRKTFINNSFEILVPNRLYDKWKSSTNWVALKKYIKGI